jgi:hypothetical protein
MSFILKTLKSPTKVLLDSIFSKFDISDNVNSSCYEQNQSELDKINLLNNISKRALENKTKLHILYDERDKNNPIPCALIALNFETIGEFFALSIDYLFVSNSYRSKSFKEIDSKISFYLLNFALQKALEVDDTSKLDAVLLTPVNECVKKVYLKFGFIEFVDDWLYVPIESIN